ncbi:MAG: hypothetical protein EBY30_08270, partial [Rhodospirillales bacterium]|nr:hypothetical protein [Rhodospirillales bacterium]
MRKMPSAADSTGWLQIARANGCDWSRLAACADGETKPRASRLASIRLSGPGRDHDIRACRA